MTRYTKIKKTTPANDKLDSDKEFLLEFFGNKVLLRISNVPIDALIHRARVVLELFVQGTRAGIELLVAQVEPQPQFVKKDSPAHRVLSKCTQSLAASSRTGWDP